MENVFNPIVRVGGINTDYLTEMKAKKTLDYIDDIEHRKLDLDKEKSGILELLERVVKETEDDIQRKELINFKRSINKGKGKLNTLEKVSSFMNLEARKRIEAYISSVESYNQDVANINEVFNEDLMKVEGLLQQVYLKNKDVANALVYINDTIRFKLDKYLKNDIRDHGCKERKLDYLLIKMLTRVALKTSPFSTFTHVGHGKWSKNGDIIKINSLDRNTSIDINHVHILRILNNILRQPEVEIRLQYKLNDTVSIMGDNITWFTRSDKPKEKSRVYKTHDNLMKVKNSGVFSEILSIYDEKKREGIHYNDLRAFLKEYINDNELEEKYIRKLIDSAFIVPHIKFYQQCNDMIGQLNGVINEIFEESEIPSNIKGYLDSLNGVNSLLKEYNNLDSEDKNSILINTHKEIKELLKEFQLDELNGASVLYEDSILSEQINFNEYRWQGVIENLKKIQTIALLYDVNVRAQVTAYEVFKSRVGDNSDYATGIGILSEAQSKFLDAWAAPYKGLRISNEIEEIRVLDDLRESFTKLLSERMKSNSDDIYITDEELNDIYENIPSVYKNVKTSHNIFLQHTKDDKFIINKIYNGDLVYFSRFLKYFNVSKEQITEYLKANNKNSNELAQISDVYGFNANLHKPFLNYELSLPNNGENYPANNEINKISWKKVGFSLSHKDKRVYCTEDGIGQFKAIFFGSLFPLLLPNVTRMINVNFNNFIFINDFYRLIEDSLTDDEKENVRVYPNIWINNVLISRKKWVIPLKELPVKKENNFDVNQFHTMNQWAKEKGLPKHVFVKILGESNSTENKKPQFIDFDNPILVKLLLKEIEGQHQMVVEPMLPAFEDHYNFEDEKYATEILLEINS